MTNTLKRYLRQVRRKLNLPRALQNRVISDLTSSIDARLEAGVSEETILQELGTPASVAAEFHEQMKEYAYRKSPWRFLFLAAAIVSAIGMLVSWLFQSLLYDLLRLDTAASVGIIGGADGPTSIFVAAAPHSPLADGIPYLVGLLVGIGGFVYFSRLKKKG